jgi:hypothetical protein
MENLGMADTLGSTKVMRAKMTMAEMIPTLLYKIHVFHHFCGSFWSVAGSTGV